VASADGERQQVRPPETRTSAPRVRRSSESDVPVGHPLWLQSTAGNRTTSELLARRSPIVVGAFDDREELEADRLAEEALGRMGLGAVRRSPGSGTTGVIGPEGGSLDDATSEELAARRGGGAPLAADLAQSYGRALGTDLASVRVHTDAGADRMARQMSASAFTLGTDIFFSSGTFAPETPSGQHVLAHELAHVRQQTSGARRSK
jgi:hypothetical protein